MRSPGRPRENADVRLFEHPDFEQAILRAEQHFRSKGLRAAVIEKDYYVTEALRQISPMSDRIIFKGGTSLSKGWNLLNRFSEDIDIFLDPAAFAQPLGANGINRELKVLRNAIAAHPALAHVRDESRTIGGFGRNDRFSYAQRFGGVGEVANRVLMEAGTASGRRPVATVSLRSYLAQFLSDTDVTLGAEDEASFPMRLLHFRRTFVEKLFAIHGKVELFKASGEPVGSYARHYYDLYQLSQTEEVPAMLQTAEYGEIKADYDAISRTHFARDYRPPKDLSFANSDALFPEGPLHAELGREYEQQCRVLCYGPYPSWDEVLATFSKLRPSI